MKSTIKKAKVSLEFQKLDANGLATFADGTVNGLTGNTNLSTPPVALATVSPQITALRTTLRQISSGNTSKALTRLEAQQVNALMQSLTTNGHYVEDTANTIAAGDLSKAEQIIASSGYKLKKKGVAHPRSFEVVESGPGWVHLRVKAVGKRAGYAWRYGITTTKDSPPAAWSKIIFTLEAEVVITNLKGAAIYCFQEASILPVAHTPKTNVAATAISRTVTPSATTKAHKATFSDGQEPLQFSDIVYYTVQ
jgi:hypothetical protein